MKSIKQYWYLFGAVGSFIIRSILSQLNIQTEKRFLCMKEKKICSFLCRPPLRSHCVRVIFATHCVCVIQYCTIKHYCANFSTPISNALIERVPLFFFSLSLFLFLSIIVFDVCEHVVGQSSDLKPNQTKQKQQTQKTSPHGFIYFSHYSVQYLPFDTAHFEFLFTFYFTISFFPFVLQISLVSSNITSGFRDLFASFCTLSKEST